MMTSLLVAIAVQGFWPTIEPGTGKNGYEEYLDAARLMRTREMDALQTYLSEWEQKGSVPASPRPAGLKEKATLLDGYRLQAKLAEQALDLIQRGNAKPVHYPWRDETDLTLHPELSGFRSLARACARTAALAFAEGEAARGSELLIRGLLFSRNIQRGTLLAVRVGFGTEGFLFKVADQHRTQLPLSFAARVNALPDPLPEWREALVVERGVLRRTWYLFLKDVEAAGLDQEDAELLRKAAQKVEPRRLPVLYERYFQPLEGPIRELQEVIGHVEGDWLRVKPEPALEEIPKLERDVTADEGVLTFKFLQLTAALNSSIAEPDWVAETTRTFAIHRVRQRLLKHTAALAKYKWEHGTYPSSLGSLYGAELKDPINGNPYRYTFSPFTSSVELEVEGLGRVGLTPTPRPTQKEDNP